MWITAISLCSCDGRAWEPRAAVPIARTVGRSAGQRRSWCTVCAHTCSARAGPVVLREERCLGDGAWTEGQVQDAPRLSSPVKA